MNVVRMKPEKKKKEWQERKVPEDVMSLQYRGPTLLQQIQVDLRSFGSQIQLPYHLGHVLLTIWMEQTVEQHS
jgi:hypothetical protein